ncbi:hypothetical protein VNI00_019211 [Paramarasmius palmivorus]|uniref:Uncharacterized protein n=1 Tax=Paramarasmius palmivorus TaxID=297713 RepID=A0AAW0APG1_9AGAR
MDNLRTRPAARKTLSSISKAALERRQLHLDGIRKLLEQRSSKAVLFFPTADEPEIVYLERRKIQANDLRPFMNAEDQEGGTATMQSTRVLTTVAAERFTLYYFEQTGRNGFDLNESISRELEGMTDGLSRPWYGPVLVIWEEDDVINADNLETLAEQIVLYINNCYESFERDGGVEYESIESGEEEG